jgi:hypothetical protein
MLIKYKFTKPILSILVICFLLVSACTVCLAQSDDSPVPQEVLKVLSSSTNEVKGVLDSEREHYGLDSLDDVQGKISFGKGYKYYILSNESLENNMAHSLKTTFKDSAAYIFPIRVDKKHAGIVFIEKYQGKWQMVQISSDLNFENDINSLLDDIKKNPKLSNSANNTMFIYDYFTDLAGIGIQTSEGEYIIPMRENKFFGIKKNEVKASSDYIKKINSFYQKVKNKTQDDKTGGIVSNSDMSTKKKTHYVVIIGVSVLGIIVGLGGIFILRKRLRENIA